MKTHKREGMILLVGTLRVAVYRSMRILCTLIIVPRASIFRGDGSVQSYLYVIYTYMNVILHGKIL